MEDEFIILIRVVKQYGIHTFEDICQFYSVYTIKYDFIYVL
jgi:hypothetical protein